MAFSRGGAGGGYKKRKPEKFDKFGRRIGKDPNAGKSHFPEKVVGPAKPKMPTGRKSESPKKSAPTPARSIAAKPVPTGKKGPPAPGRKAPGPFKQVNAPAPPRPKGGGGPSRPAGGGGGGRARGGGGGGGGGAGSGYSSFDKLLKDIETLRKGFINPETYARSLTDEEYNPVISGLLMEQAKAARQQQHNVGTIDRWFDELSQFQANKVAPANAAATQQAVSGMENFGQKLIESMGGGANPGSEAIGKDVLAQTGMLQQLGTAQSSFDQDMRSLIQLQGAEAKTREQRYMQEQREGIAKELSDTRRSKGKALTRNRFDAQRSALEQRAAYQNLLLGATMAPMEMENARLGLQNQRLGLQTQRQQNRAARRKDKFDIALQRQAIRKGKLEIENMMNQLYQGNTPSWDQLSPEDKLALEDTLAQRIPRGPRGGPNIRPVTAYNMLGNILRSASGGRWDPKTNNAIQQWRDTLILNMYPNRQEFPMPWLFERARY